MPKALHAVDYLAAPQKHPPMPVCVVFGDETFLKRQVIGQLRHAVLGDEEGDLSLSLFEGPTAVLADVMAELATVAMFGDGRRLAVIDQADPFVSRHRAELEDYVAGPKSSGVLVLDVKTWPANTRLYKAVAADGLMIGCSAPPPKKLTGWLGAWARKTHHVQLAPAAAETLVEMVGPELGLLDQELAKLALAAGSDGRITAEMVGRMVGTWRAKTTWQMIDAALDGQAAQAIVQLDRLLLAGESPVGILAQVSASLRRLAAATRLVLQAEAAGRRVSLRDALGRAGVKSFVLDKSQRQLRRIGRHRGSLLYRWLLQADLDLKGASPLPPRLILERLILRLAAPSPPRQTASGR